MSVDLNTIPDFLCEGAVTNIGSHEFTAEEIIRFAQKYDPQTFHTDPEKAAESIFGGLCASGWHTVSVWMKLQRNSVAKNTSRLKSEDQAWPEFGPSPGMRNLRWKLPVFAGDTITYSNRIVSIRPSKSKPDWWVMSNSVSAENQHGKTVMEFHSSVLLKIHTPPAG